MRPDAAPEELELDVAIDIDGHDPGDPLISLVVADDDVATNHRDEPDESVTSAGPHAPVVGHVHEVDNEAIVSCREGSGSSFGPQNARTRGRSAAKDMVRPTRLSPSRSSVVVIGGLRRAAACSSTTAATASGSARTRVRMKASGDSATKPTGSRQAVRLTGSRRGWRSQGCPRQRRWPQPVRAGHPGQEGRRSR